jgi:hypothetical protein
VFAIVQHEEQILVLQVVAQGLDKRLAGLLLDTQRRGKRQRHGGRVAQTGEFDKIDTIAEAGQDAGGDFQRQAGLADPTHAGEGDKTAGGNQAGNLMQLRLAANKAGKLVGQV